MILSLRNLPVESFLENFFRKYSSNIIEVMKMKAIIFDFDGLIVDTESIWYESYKEVLSNYGYELELERFSKIIGTHDTEFFSYITRELQVEPGEIEKAARKLYSVKMGEPALREGVEDYLKEAKELGLKIGLASSSNREWVEGYLKQLNIFKYFDVIKTSNDVSEVKPNPELYLKAIESLGITSSEAFAFEDSLNGLKAARAAGLQCVIVPNPVTAHLDFTDYSLRLASMGERSLQDVINIVREGSQTE